MELKQIIQCCAYRIEPKPEGGFIARASDPSVPAIEGTTREEVQQQVQAKLVATLGAVFPNLKLPESGRQVTYSMHVDRKPGGGFSVHTDNPGTPRFNPEAQEKFDHHAEELLGFLDKHFPHLSEQIASQVVGKELPIVVKETITTSTKSGSLLRMFTPTAAMSEGNAQSAVLEGGTIKSPGLDPALLTNTPIVPQDSKSSPFLRLVLLALILAAVMYFVFYHH
jgi:hypothetical protein